MKQFLHKILIVFRLYPGCSYPHLNFRSLQFFRLYLFQCPDIALIFRVTFSKCLCNPKFLSDISRQVLIPIFPLVCQRIFKDYSCQFFFYFFFGLSGNLCHIRKINPCLFVHGYRKCLTGCFHACHCYRTFNGSLIEHIRFTLQGSIFIQIFQRTQQTVR